MTLLGFSVLWLGLAHAQEVENMPLLVIDRPGDGQRWLPVQAVRMPPDSAATYAKVTEQLDQLLQTHDVGQSAGRSIDETRTILTSATCAPYYRLSQAASDREVADTRIDDQRVLCLKVRDGNEYVLRLAGGVVTVFMSSAPLGESQAVPTRQEPWLWAPATIASAIFDTSCQTGASLEAEECIALAATITETRGWLREEPVRTRGESP